MRQRRDRDHRVGAIQTENRWLALCFCAITFVFGALAMAGWIWSEPQLRSFLAAGAQMKPNAALCLMLLGLALAFRFSKVPAEYLNALSTVLALLAALIAALTIFEYSSGMNLGIDELLFRDLSTIAPSAPGRMSRSEERRVGKECRSR